MEELGWGASAGLKFVFVRSGSHAKPETANVVWGKTGVGKSLIGVAW